jgi:hypothetical protein
MLASHGKSIVPVRRFQRPHIDPPAKPARRSGLPIFVIGDDRLSG